MLYTMTVNNKVIASALLVALGVGLYACNDFLTEVNPNDPNEEGFFVGPQEATESVNAVYASLQSRGLYKRQYFPVEYLSGDFVPTDGAGAQWTDLYNLNIEPINPELISTLWADAYTGIARANFALERVGAMTESEIDAALQRRLLGEAHFLRGVYYFHLVTVYGRVPLVDHVINGSDDPDFKPARAEVADVWAFIEADLAAAVAALPRVDEYAATEVGRASKGAAQGFLGKAHLYQEDWEAATETLGALLAQPDVYGAYDLTSNYNDNFSEATENNVESLFEVQFFEGVGNEWANDDSGSDTESGYFETHFSPYEFGNAYPSQEVNDFFDEHLTGTDSRRRYTIAREGDEWNEIIVHVTDPGTGEPFFNSRISSGGGTSGIRKYISGVGEPFLQSGNNIRLMRLADVLLMYAESLNESGATSAAYEPINRVRARAGATPLPTGLDQAGLREAIKTERRLELTFECFRWFDVVRWGDGPTTFADRGFQADKHEYLPISPGDLLLNENLIQTRGY